VSPSPGEHASAQPERRGGADPYARSGRRWALGAELVYRPIAIQLVDMSPHLLAGRTVLDAGAGTGAVSAALIVRHAKAVAIDFSAAMLAWNVATRPPCAVADIRALPFAASSVDDAIAAFVLNHLTDPETGLAELARVTRPGGAILATVFSSHSTSEARDRIDAAAHDSGWRAPPWYTEFKASAIPLLANPEAMAAAAHAAGLAGVHAEERAVDVGITQPHELVTYRLGHPIFAAWLDALGPSRSRGFAAEAERAIREVMHPYRPVVVFLRARTRS